MVIQKKKKKLVCTLFRLGTASFWSHQENVLIKTNKAKRAETHSCSRGLFLKNDSALSQLKACAGRASLLLLFHQMTTC